MRLTTRLRRADPVPARETTLSARARAELRGLVGDQPDASAAPVPATGRRLARPVVLAAAASAVVGVIAIGIAVQQAPVAGLPAVPSESATPAETADPAGTGRWVEVAPGPLAGRRDAVTAWVDDSYLVIGGTTTPPCTQVAGCDQEDIQLTDGARYSPATDSWAPIADAPIPTSRSLGASNPYPRAAVIGKVVYLLQNDGFLAYSSDTDHWESLPAPPSVSYLAGATADAVVAYPGSQCGEVVGGCKGSGLATYYTFSPGTGDWSSHTAELPLPNDVHGATVAGDHLVVSWLDGNTLGVASVDLASGKVTGHPNLGTSQRPVPEPMGDWAFWPGEEDFAWLLNTAAKELAMVAMPTRPGPFTASIGPWRRDLHVTTGTMIALGGQLYDPASELWSVAPAMPVPGQDPVVAGGSDVILACFGWDGVGYSRGCYTLRPAAADLRSP